MRVLVTGHKGYIGTCLVPMLLEQGFEVTGLDSDLFAACTFDGELEEVPELRKDTRDVIAADLAGFDAIIHLAGLSNDPLGDYDPALTDEINCRASVRIAKLARDVGVKRFLFASSCSNYGAAGEQFLTEDAAFNPVTPYGVSKVEVEQAVSGLATARFSPVFLRASTAYGMSPRIRFDLVLNNLTAWAFTTGRVYIKSDGTPWRPIVHVEDICRAYIAALLAPTEASITAPSTSAAPPRTTRSTSWRASSNRSCPAAGSSSPPTRGRTSAATASTATASRERCMASSRSGRRAAASNSCTRSTAASASSWKISRASASSASPT
jgi:nucleoside-diphosphate-sugar epimerase